MPPYTGVSHAIGDSEAGFRKAANAAVDDYKNSAEYKAWLDAPEPKDPARLKVAEMYVDVRNPIHDYIVVLRT